LCAFCLRQQPYNHFCLLFILYNDTDVLWSGYLRVTIFITLFWFFFICSSSVCLLCKMFTTFVIMNINVISNIISSLSSDSVNYFIIFHTPLMGSLMLWRKITHSLFSSSSLRISTNNCFLINSIDLVFREF